MEKINKKEKIDNTLEMFSDRVNNSYFNYNDSNDYISFCKIPKIEMIQNKKEKIETLFQNKKEDSEINYIKVNEIENLSERTINESSLISSKYSGQNKNVSYKMYNRIRKNKKLTNIKIKKKLNKLNLNNLSKDSTIQTQAQSSRLDLITSIRNDNYNLSSVNKEDNSDTEKMYTKRITEDKKDDLKTRNNIIKYMESQNKNIELLNLNNCTNVIVNGINKVKIQIMKMPNISKSYFRTLNKLNKPNKSLINNLEKMKNVNHKIDNLDKYYLKTQTLIQINKMD